MLINYQEIRSVNLSHLVSEISRRDHKSLIVGKPGDEHYPLLAYLASQINNGLIVELGTHEGTSSAALCSNKSNRVITYDIKNFYTAKQPQNLERVLGNIFDLDPSIMLEADLIFIDTAHTGEFERQVYSYLVENNYKGITVWDDIHWSREMIAFWNELPEEHKYDITDIGHGGGRGPLGDRSGTGIVDFSGTVQIIK